MSEQCVGHALNAAGHGRLPENIEHLGNAVRRDKQNDQINLVGEKKVITS